MIECAEALWSNLLHASTFCEVAAGGQRVRPKGAIPVR